MLKWNDHFIKKIHIKIITLIWDETDTTNYRKRHKNDQKK